MMISKKYLVAIAVIIVIVAGLGFWYVNQPAPEKTAEEKPTPQVFSLTVMDNNVQVKSYASAQFVDVAGVNTTVTEGSYIKTSLTGRAIVESENQSKVVIDKNSEFSVTESGKNKTVISLVSGDLWATVQKLFGQGEYFKIQTPNAVATVRGTSFGVFYKNNVTTVMVTDSKVSLQSLDPVTKQLIGQEVVINQNQKGVVVKDGAVVSDLTAADKRLDWYLFNQPSVGTKKETTTSSSSGDTAPKDTKDNAASGGSNSNQNQNPPAGPELFSVNPTAIYIERGSANFSINGKNLSKITTVSLGDINVEFSIKDDQTITATIGQNIKPGVYDVSVGGSAGEYAILPQALSVK